MERIIYTPASFKKSGLKCSERKRTFRSFVYLSCREHFSVVEKPAVIPSVVLLFFLICPTTIIFEISKIWVDTIQRVFPKRTHSHISNKYREVVPFFANRYASPTIEIIIRIIGIVTTAKHSCPCSVFWRTSEAVGGKSSLANFFAKTSARLHITASQVPGIRSMQVPAIALALPDRTIDSPQNNQTAESAIGNINEFLRHRFYVPTFLHGVKVGGYFG